MIGFLGGSYSQRVTWAKEYMSFDLMLGESPLVLFWNRQEGDNLYTEDAPIYAPGLKGSINMDICLEFALATKGIRNIDDVSTEFANTVVPEYEVRAVRDPFWHQSGRIVVRILFQAVLLRWKGILSGVGDVKMMGSISQLFLDMYQEVTALKLTQNGASRKDIKKPAWWGYLDKGQQNILNSLIFQNAGTTAGSIFAEVASYSSFLNEFTGVRGVSPVFSDQERPVFINIARVSCQSLYAILKAYTLNSTGRVFAFEVSSWEENTLKVVAEAMGAGFRKNNLLWTGHNTMFPDGESGDVLWGHIDNHRLLAEFSNMVKQTSGNPSGLLTALYKENPGELEDDEALAQISGDWSVITAQEGELNTDIKMPLGEEGEFCVSGKLREFQDFAQYHFGNRAMPESDVPDFPWILDDEPSTSGETIIAEDIEGLPERDYTSIQAIIEQEINNMEEQGIFEEEDNDENI